MAASKTFKYQVVTVVNIDPLKALDNALKGIANSVSSLSKAFSSMGKGLSNSMSGAKDSVKDLTDSLKGLALAAGALGAIKWVAGGVFDFGKKIIEAAKFKQSALTTLGTFYGDKNKDIFGGALKVATMGPADTKPLLDRTFKLASSGFSAYQLGKIQTLLSDVEGGGGNESVLDGMVQAFNAIAGGGRPELGSSFITDFVGKSRFARYQAKAAGVKDWQTGNLDELNKKVIELQRSGKFSPTASTQGLEEALNDKLKQNFIGETSTKQSKTSLAGALSNLSSVWDTLALSMDFDKIPGIAKFRDIINEISETLTSDAFKGALNDIITKMFGPLESIKAGDTTKFLLGLLDKAQKLWEWLGKAWDFMKRLLVTDSGGALKDIFMASADAFKYLGKLIGEGIRSSFNPFGSSSEEESTVASGAKSAAAGAGVGSILRAGSVVAVDVDPNSVMSVEGGQSKAPTNITTYMTINGNANPEEVKNAAESGTKSALEKANKMKDLRKAGRAS